MAKRKKRATAVSRLTLVACSPSDLLLFTQAVEQLTWAIHDLRMVVAAMPKPRARKPPLVTSMDTDVSNQPALPEM